jgi:hypothetical protein
MIGPETGNQVTWCLRLTRVMYQMACFCARVDQARTGVRPVGSV